MTIFLTECYPQNWQTGMIALLLEIKASVEQVRQKQPHLPEEQQTCFEQRYDRLIEEGLKLHPLPGQKDRPRNAVEWRKARPGINWSGSEITKRRCWRLWLILKRENLTPPPAGPGRCARRGYSPRGTGATRPGSGCETGAGRPRRSGPPAATSTPARCRPGYPRPPSVRPG